MHFFLLRPHPTRAIADLDATAGRIRFYRRLAHTVENGRGAAGVRYGGFDDSSGVTLEAQVRFSKYLVRQYRFCGPWQYQNPF